ncbi:uncharacterized protein [Gossypium hirsutum]|uniref:Nuclear transcription factor Y subunit n=1 Tax=Gossypium hirsutum TaxID=3635 RepID=A0ABM3AMT5_GOSHI|nr:uncharacterized protein LOC107891196 [Gossypium hirsutum]
MEEWKEKTSRKGNGEMKGRVWSAMDVAKEMVGHYLVEYRRSELVDTGDTGDGQKPQAAISVQSAPSEHCARFQLGFGQPLACAKYPYMDQCYGVFSTYGPQVSGRVMLPLNLATEDGPIYVNAKQYNGIIRRRQSRAKAVLYHPFLWFLNLPYLLFGKTFLKLYADRLEERSCFLPRLDACDFEVCHLH